MAMNAKELIIPVDIQLKMEDFGPRAGVELVKTEFGKLTKVTDRATNMMNQFAETVNHINTNGVDKFAKKLYDTQKVGVEAAQEILSAYSRIDAIMSEVIRGKELIPAGKSLDDLRAERRAIEDNLTALMQEEKYLERELPNAIEKTKKEIASVIGQLGVLGRERKKGFMPLAQFVENQNDVARLKERLTELRAEYAKLTATQETSSATLAKNRETITQLEEKLLELKNILAANKGLTSEEEITISRNLRSMARGFAKLNEQELRVGVIKNSYKNANKEATKFHTNSMRYARKHNSVLKTMANLVKKISHHFKDVLKNTRKSFDSSQNGMKQALRNVMRYGLGVRSLYFLFRRLRAAAKDAFGVMAQQWEPVNRQISSMIQALNGVKGSIATMLQPLLEGFSKIFVQFMNGLQKVMETIGAFFAYLTGQNYILRAKAGNIDWADHLADKLGQAKDEAEELNKQLAGFDKINNLTTKDDKDSGNDKSSIGLDTVTFEKVPIEKLDLFNWLKEMWEKSDFTELGEFLNQKLLNALKKLDWDKIEEMGRKIGHCLATAINGFFKDKELATELGEAVAGWLNTKFATLDEFADTVEWDKIGDFIVTGITKFFDEADTQTWGDAVASLIRGLLEGLYTIVSNGDMWTGLGQKIHDWLKGFQEGMAEETDTFDMDGWELLGSSIGEILLGIIDAATVAISDTDMWEGFGEGIAKVLREIPWYDLITELPELAWAIITALAATFDGLTEEFGKTLAESIGGPEFADAFGEQFGEGIKISVNKAMNPSGISNMFGTVVGMIKVIRKLNSDGVSIARSFTDGFEEEYGNRSISDILERDGVIDKKLFDKSASEITGKGNTLATRFISGWMQGIVEERAKGRSGKFLGPVQGLLRMIGVNIDLSEVFTKILDKINDFKTKITTKWQEVKDSITSIIDGIKSIWSNFWTNLFTKWSESIKKREGHLTKFEEFLQLLSLAVTEWGREWSEFWEKLPEKIDEFKTNASEKFIEIKTTISDKVHEIATNLSEKWTEVTDAWSSLWTNMAEIIKTPINNIIDLINNGLIASIEGMMNGLGSGISEFANSGTGKFLGFDKIPVFTIEIPRIPHLAKGAVIPPNNQFLAMLGDQKSGTNIEAPLSTIEDAVRNVLAEQNINVTFEVQGDPEHIFNVVRKQSNQFTRRTGLSWT